MSPKPRIHRRINLLHFPAEILALIVATLRWQEVYSLRLTCKLLYQVVDASTTQLLPHGEDDDVIISTKCILTMQRIQVIPLDYVVASKSNDELLAISQHPTLRCFALDTTYMDGSFHSHVDMFLASFDMKKDYDISFVYKNEDSFRLDKENLVLGYVSSDITNLLTKLSSFNITTYRGGYRGELSLLTNLSSLDIVKPEHLGNLNLLITPKVTHLHFTYTNNELGSCIFHTNSFIEIAASRHLVFPNVTYLGPIDIHGIHKINIVFPRLEVIEISLFSILSRGQDATLYHDALHKYRKIVVDTEFYHLGDTQIHAIFPQDLRDKVILHRRNN